MYNRVRVRMADTANDYLNWIYCLLSFRMEEKIVTDMEPIVEVPHLELSTELQQDPESRVYVFSHALDLEARATLLQV